MARREYVVSTPCAHEGCRERSFYVCDTRREQTETLARHREKGWRCVRHTSPDEVLSADNPWREQVLIACPESYGQFWRPPERTDKGGSGFTYGPGFKAYAEDFPPGTRLVVSARVELPEEPGT